MAKTLVALTNNNSFNSNLFQVAESLYPNINNELFVGLLLQGISYKENIASYLEDTSLKGLLPDKNAPWSESDNQKAEVIALFEEKAQKRKLNYKIYNDFEVSGYDLVKQSVYADLLVFSYNVFFDPETSKPDSTFIYQLLKGCKCPVLILPVDTKSIDNVIFTYDGKESSVFAIRMFSTLFSNSMKDKEVTVLTVTPSAEEEIKNERLLLELVKQHHTNVGVQLLEGTNISDEIIEFAESVSNPLLVMGAYGRSHISNLLIPSVAKNILKQSRYPIFIAHK